VGAAETDRQIIQKVTILWRSGSTLSTRSGSNDSEINGVNIVSTRADAYQSDILPVVNDGASYTVGMSVSRRWQWNRIRNGFLFNGRR
jgi:hypothetical protein